MRKFLIGILALSAFTACKNEPHKTVARVGDYTVDFDTYVRRYKEYLFNSAMKDNLVTRKQVAQNMAHELLLRRAFARSNERIAVRHLYAPTLEKARALYKALQAGANFEALARETFTDSTLKNNGGYLGYIRWGDMDPAFEDTAYSLQPGQYSHPVKTAQGYSIVKVEDRKPAPIITENQYLNARNGIQRIVRINKMKPAEQAFLKQRFDSSKLRFFEDGLAEWLQKAQEIPGDKDNTIPLAAYDDQTYSLADIRQKLNRLPSSLQASIVDIPTLKAAVTGLLIQEKLLREAHEKGYDHVDIVQEKQQNARTNVYLKFKFREIVHKYTVPDSALRAYYGKHITDFQSPRRMAVSEILTAGRDRALEVKEQLLRGVPFETLARRYSLRKRSAERGGEMGLADWNRYGFLKEKLWKAPLNTVLGPWEVQKFYALFRVTRREEPARQPFETVRDEVEKQYKQEYAWKIVFLYLNDLYEKAPVSYNWDLIKSFVLKEDGLR